MNHYRIFLGVPGRHSHDAMPERVASVCRDLFPQGATITSGYGVWKRKTERAVIIDVVAFDSSITFDVIRANAKVLGITFEQSAVLITVDTVTADLVQITPSPLD